MFRGSLVTFIFSKTLRLHSAADHEADAMTLMSADIDRIDMSMHVVHDVYTSLIELPVSLWLLYRLLGVSVSAPAAYAIGTFPVNLPLYCPFQSACKELNANPRSMCFHWHSNSCRGR